MRPGTISSSTSREAAAGSETHAKRPTTSARGVPHIAPLPTSWRQHLFLGAAFVLLLESALEEIYFRGFLLPRMGYAGRSAVPLHSLLFALYHLWMPWRIVALAVAMRRFRIRILLGDRVRVEMSPYDLTRGRVSYRYR